MDSSTHDMAEPSQRLQPSTAFHSPGHQNPWPAREPSAFPLPLRTIETIVADKAHRLPVPATSPAVPPPPPPNAVEFYPYVCPPAAAPIVDVVLSPAMVGNPASQVVIGPLQVPPQGTAPDASERTEVNTAAPQTLARVEAAQFELAFEGTRSFTLVNICVDTEVQTRAKLDDATVEDYAEAMRAGEQFPAVVLFVEGTKYRLADGFHRYEAASRAGLEMIQAQVKSGGRSEAIKYALQANVGHGLRRTNADKRRGVEIALKEFGAHSDRVIAKLCAVGNALVGEVRRHVFESNTSAVRKGRDGKDYPAANPATNKQRTAGKSPREKSTSGAGAKSTNDTAQPESIVTVAQPESTPAIVQESLPAGAAQVANDATKLIPANLVQDAVEKVTARGSSLSEQAGLLPHVRRLVPLVAALLNQHAHEFPDSEGRDLSRALGMANTKLQLAMGWA